MVNVFKVGLLVADIPSAAVLKHSGDYVAIYTRWLTEAVERRNTELREAQGPHDVVQLHVLSYDVKDNMEYPSEKDLDTFSCIMITGSAASAYENTPWIVRLVDFIQQTTERHPLLHFIGICFGHQVIARAYGAQVEKCREGWELGVYDVNLTPEGREILLPPRLDKDRLLDATLTAPAASGTGSTLLAIQEVHQDHVPRLPPRGDFVSLGSTALCPIQGMVRRQARPSSSEHEDNRDDDDDDASAPQRGSMGHILTLQGHPEFTGAIVTSIARLREASHILTPAFSQAAQTRASAPHSGILLGESVLRFCGF